MFSDEVIRNSSKKPHSGSRQCSAPAGSVWAGINDGDIVSGLKMQPSEPSRQVENLMDKKAFDFVLTG